MAVGNIKGFYVYDEENDESGIAHLATDSLDSQAVTGPKIADGAVSETKLGSALKTKVNRSDPNNWAVIDDDETYLEAINIGGTVYDIKADALEEDVSGSFDSLTAGGAKQLLSTVYVDDNEPYNFRTAGGSADIGDRMYEEVVGGSIVWNQYYIGASSPITYGNVTGTKNADGYTWTVSGTSTAAGSLTLGGVDKTNGSFISNHVYAMFTGVKNGSTATYYCGIAGFVLDTGNGGLYKHTYDFESTKIRLDFKAGVTFDNLVLTPQWIDLTQMFGSTIADYIYSLEQGSAGAGVAWFRKLFPKPCYEYNTGEIMSVKAGSHDTVGFNAWDEEWEVGGYNVSDGTKRVSTANIRCKNKIPVLPNTNYYHYFGSGTMNVILYYDANENYLGSSYAVGLTYSEVRRTPNNAYFMTFQMGDVYGSTYKNDICINLAWDGERNGEYEPYEKHTYPLANIELRGIPKLDANNQLYYDGDTYASDGTVTRRYGIRAYQSGDESLADAITDGTNTVYKLSTPTTETADTFVNPQVVDDFGTEEYTDYAVEAGDRDVAIPVGHNSQYMNNLRAKLEMAPESPSGDGKYIVQQSNCENAYVPYTADGRLDAIEAKLPAPPSANGTYKLTATVTDGGVTYTWVAG